jgi:putative endonuclease
LARAARSGKKWRRAWKLRLIEDGNPQWRDLYDDLLK